MGIKPDIVEKGEQLIDQVNETILPKVEPSLDNVTAITDHLRNATLFHLDELLVRVKRWLPLVIVSLCVCALAAVGTLAGVVVLLVR